MTVRSGWLLNASTATPAQSRADTRLAPIGTMTPTGALTSRSGVIPGGTPLLLTGTGMSGSVATGRAIIQGSGTQGAYPVVITAAEAITIANGHASLPRIDSVFLIAYDTLFDTSGLTLARIEYVQGTANAIPSAPAPPATTNSALRLWDILVPAGASAGSPINWGTALTDRRVYTVPAGGICPDPAAAGAYAGQWRDGAGATGILERYSGSAWEAAVRLGNSGLLSLGDVSLTRSATSTLQVNGNLAVTGIGQVIAKVKGADLGRNNTTTLTADPDLSGIAVAAGCTYAVDATIFYSAHQDVDLKIQWSGPAGATLVWHGDCLPTGSTGTTGTTIYDAQNIGSTYVPGGPDTGNATIMTLRVTGTLVVAGTAGTFGLTWAQNVSNAVQTFLRAGSRLRLERIA